MSLATLLRWCAVVTVVAGGLEIVITSLEFTVVPKTDIKDFSVQAASTAWSIQQVVNWPAKLLLLWSLVGLYLRQVPQAGRFGFATFVLAFIGTALEFGTIWGFSIIAPSLAMTAPGVLDSTVQLTPVLAGIFVPFVLMALGWPLFALASLRAKVLPRLGLVLIAIGPLLFFVGLRHVPDLLFGSGLILLGADMWAPRRELTRLKSAELGQLG